MYELDTYIDAQSDFPDILLDGFCHQQQKTVPFVVTERVVDGLEVIDVYVHEGKVVVVATCPFDLCVGQFAEMSPVGYAGQWVYPGNFFSAIKQPPEVPKLHRMQRNRLSCMKSFQKRDKGYSE